MHIEVSFKLLGYKSASSNRARRRASRRKKKSISLRVWCFARLLIMNSLMRMVCSKGGSGMGSLSGLMNFGGMSDSAAMIDMQLSTESLDLLDGSPYQTEIAFNKLLPYSDKLDEEADKFLAYVKDNLGRCIMLRDINSGCVYWSQMLTK